MAEYPEIGTGIGVLTPELWHRLMAALNVEEKSNVNEAKPSSANSNFDERRRKIPESLVRIKNDNETETIVMGEACCVTGTVLGTNLAACIACTGDDPCAYGECGEWPDAYTKIRKVAFTEMMTFNVRTVRTTPKEFVPLPGGLQRWFIAASNIAAGQSGWAHSTGFHWAWVWDPVGLLEMGSGSYKQSEALFVDLPDPTFEDGETDENMQTYLPYDPDNQWQVAGNRKIYSPLMVRPQGSARILYADTTDELFPMTIAGGSAGDGNKEWPISAADAAGTGITGMDAKIRLALIERCGWTVPCLPAEITDGTKRLMGEGVGVEQDYQYEYDWKHSTGLTDYELGSGGTRRAYNLAEYGNCVCTSSTCTNCCESTSSCARVAGVPIPRLTQCFGECEWYMQPIGGWGCAFNPNGQYVNMHLTLDSTGLQRPTFTLQNTITWGEC
tara:strand:+ start:902 stop:2230 length:1329 start_codon:yes stop_codon:yes gene_type:complete